MEELKKNSKKSEPLTLDDLDHDLEFSWWEKGSTAAKKAWLQDAKGERIEVADLQKQISVFLHNIIHDDDKAEHMVLTKLSPLANEMTCELSVDILGPLDSMPLTESSFVRVMQRLAFISGFLTCQKMNKKSLKLMIDNVDYGNEDSFESAREREHRTNIRKRLLTTGATEREVDLFIDKIDEIFEQLQSELQFSSKFEDEDEYDDD